MTEIDPKTFLAAIFNAAVAAADPQRTIRDHLPATPKGRTIVIGAG
ncbi:MAG: glycerate kinase, partial [Mesorhizobium sp.]